MPFKNPLNFIKKANKSFNVYLKNYKKINNFLDMYKKDQQKIDQLLETYGKNQEIMGHFLNNYEKDHNRSAHFTEKYNKNQEKIDQFLKDYEKDQERSAHFTEKYNKNQQKIDQLLDNYDENQKKIDFLLNSNNSINDNLKMATGIFNENYNNSKEYFFNGEEHLFKEIMDTDQFFQMCFFNNIKLLSYSPSENKIYLKTEDDIILGTNNRYYTIKEIFTRGGYSVPQLYQFKEFVVFDIGMNRGYASLKFANFDSCKAVYGFEISDETYNFALENFSLNPKLSPKIKPYNFGLSNENKDIDIYYLPGCDGVTTTELEFTNIQNEWLNGKDRMKTKKAEVKEAGAVISNIIKKENIDCNIILKIDTEGSEHKIIDNLIKWNILNKADLIMGEIHLESEDLDNKLVEFKNVSKVYHGKTIYSFCYVKDRFYNMLPLKIH